MKDIDTDMIIPAQFLTSISRKGFGENLFCRLREQDPAFPLNNKQFQGAEILVADSNFGCGSSREHAVWALSSYGFRVVIAKSFADIFSSNSAKNGLLLVTLPPEEIDGILDRSQDQETILTVNLETQTVLLPSGKTLAFDYDPFRKHCLLHGLDDIDYILSHKQEIQTFRERQDSNRFMSTKNALQ